MKSDKMKKGDIVFVLLILVSIAAMVNVLVLNSQYLSGASEQAVLTAQAYSLDASEKFSGKFEYIRQKTKAVADIARSSAEKSELNDLLNSVFGEDEKSEIVDLRCFKGEKEYDRHGAEVTQKENPNVLEMRSKGEVATYGIIYDVDGTRPSIACYCPIEGDSLIDGLLVFYSQDSVLAVSENFDREKLKYAELSVICSGNYRNELHILSVLQDKSGELKENDSLLGYIENFSGDVKQSEMIKKAIVGGNEDTVSMVINNEGYVAVVGRGSEKDTGLYIIDLYREKEIYSDNLALIESGIITMALLLVVFAIFAVYHIISRRRIYARIEELDTVDALLRCPTLVKFERDAKETLASFKNAKFAVVVSHLQHFGYLNEKYGDAASTAVLRHLRDVFKNAMTYAETYAHIENGEFVLLLRYKAEENLEKRLLSLYSVAKKHFSGDEIPQDYDIKLLFGIYKVEKDGVDSVSKMVDNALKVSDMPARTDVNKVYNYFDETGKSDYMLKAEIENRMESALQTGEFRLFYQPKYNLISDRIDGAEILVRWYNPETKNYRSPAEFLPVFKENGFIAKLDRQIYYTACENTFNWIKEGRKVFPISVNISRVTAIQPDFLDYYVTVKKRFNIPDGYITLEFTESFAYENYEYLSTVAKKLRAAGFLCSIDDFGTGYSSFNILKLLDMDEIKFDKFFLDKGTSKEKDDIISKYMIDIGNEIGLKTTQEGVETLEDVQKLRAMGCKVIQGYYFAKPMSSNDYKKFIEDFAVNNFMPNGKKQ